MEFRNVTTEVEEEYEVDNELIDKVLKEYQKLHKEQKINPAFNHLDFLNLNLPVLTPAQINLFFQIAINNLKGSTWENYESKFLNTLIYNSYSYGHNNFKLNTPKGVEFSWLFNNLNGENDNPISITLYGDGGKNFAYSSKNCTYNINGDVDIGFSQDSENCIYNLHGKMKENVGGQYFSNTYHFFKKVKSLGYPMGNRVDRIERCTFILYEGIDKLNLPQLRNCTLRTTDLKTYKQIVSSFREYKSTRMNSHEKTRNSFKDDSNLLKETFIYDSYRETLDPVEYKKVQLIK